MTNMSNKSILLCILALILLTGCPGLSERAANKDLGKGYFYHETANLPTITNMNSNKGIPGLVISYAKDSTYIIALEKELEISIEEKNELVKEGKYYRSAVKKGIEKYWIIDKTTDSIFGPMSKSEFIRSREVLGIPNTLKLD